MTYPAPATAPYFSGARLGVKPKADPYGDISPLRIAYSFLNYTPQPVTVGLRNGLKMSIPYEINYLRNDFVVQMEIFVSSAVKENLRHLLNGVDDRSPAELRTLKEALNNQLEAYTGRVKYSGPVTFILDYSVPYDKLRAMGGSVYNVESDYLISLLKPADAPDHPYSEEGRKALMVASAPVELSESSFGYSVEVVDNTGTYGPRYVNIAGQVYQVKPRRDPTRRDGIYIASPKPSLGDYQSDELVVEHHSFDSQDLEDLGIFKTFEEADTLGDLSLARKRELAELDQDNLRMKRELERQRQDSERIKHENDLEKSKSDKKIKDLETEAAEAAARHKKREQDLEHELAMARMRAKDYYEGRAQRRKDESEALKILPSIIIGIGAILMAFKTLRAAA